VNKVNEIILSYANMLNPTEEQKYMAEIRLATCMSCEQCKENALGIEYCGLCGCAMKVTVFSPKGFQACPLKKWEL